MDTLFVLRHRDAGPLATYLTPFEAGRDMARVLVEEPDWRHDMWIDVLEVDVEEPSRP